MRQEEQQFELLGKVRLRAKKGRVILNDALSKSQDELVEVGEVFLEGEEAKKLRSILQRAERTKNEDKMKKLLTEGTIPSELILTDTFWEEMDKLIYDIHCNEEER